MTQRGMRALVIQVVKVVVVSGCVIALLTGCSSRLRTTIVSGSEAPKVQVTQLEPEIVTVEDVVTHPVQKEVRMDISLEESARPALQRELPAEIFATPKSIVAPSEISSFSEAPAPVSADEPIASSMTAVPSMQLPSKGVPSISFEPEMPSVAKSPVDIPSRQESPAAQKPIQVAKVMQQEPEQVEITSEALEAALSDIYFDYDQFAIREDAGELLKANAQLFASKFADTPFVIEGHCDERGTQSYNMVLGERRAKAVKHFLQDLGVPAENLQVVSYGKDKPFCNEQTEACWQENRRGHFVIK